MVFKDLSILCSETVSDQIRMSNLFQVRNYQVVGRFGCHLLVAQVDACVLNWAATSEFNVFGARSVKRIAART
jgi:hypothetical protein